MLPNADATQYDQNSNGVASYIKLSHHLEPSSAQYSRSQYGPCTIGLSTKYTRNLNFPIA